MIEDFYEKESKKLWNKIFPKLKAMDAQVWRKAYDFADLLISDRVTSGTDSN